MLKPMFLGTALAVALSCQAIAGPLQDKTAEAEKAEGEALVDLRDEGGQIAPKMRVKKEEFISGMKMIKILHIQIPAPIIWQLL